MSATTIATPAVVMMTKAEAQRCVDRIKSNLEQVRALLLDLYEREGWRALGYANWRECVTAELKDSLATVYRQLRAARIDREISQVEKNAVPLPTAQADELARLPDATSRQRAYVQAREESNGKPTAAKVREVVSRTASKPTPRRAADPDVCQVTSDDDTALGFEPEPGEGRAYPEDGEVVARCGRCGERTTGAHACGVPDEAQSDPLALYRPPAVDLSQPKAARAFPYLWPQPCTACGGDIVVVSIQDERAIEDPASERDADGNRLRLLCERCQLRDAYPPDPVSFDAAPPAAESSRPEPALTRDPESEPAPAVTAAEPETIADFQELIFRKLSPGQVTGLVARCLKEKMDERGVQATAAFAASLLGRTVETAPTAPAEAAESSTGDERPIARRYAEGMTAAVLLTKLDPAEVVGSLTPAQRAGAKAQHAVVRKWLDDLDLAIFKADQRSQPVQAGAR